MKFPSSIFFRGEAEPPRKKMEEETRNNTGEASRIFLPQKTIYQSCEEFVPSGMAMYRTLLSNENEHRSHTLQARCGTFTLLHFVRGADGECREYGMHPQNLYNPCTKYPTATSRLPLRGAPNYIPSQQKST